MIDSVEKPKVVRYHSSGNKRKAVSSSVKSSKKGKKVDEVEDEVGDEVDDEVDGDDDEEADNEGEENEDALILMQTSEVKNGKTRSQSKTSEAPPAKPGKLLVDSSEDEDEDEDEEEASLSFSQVCSLLN